MTWEIVVGLETHTQLLTRSKIFSGAPNAFGAAPNAQASAVDIALPGVLPVLNRTALEYAVRFGLAIGGRINQRSVFARENYFYPDLPKGYQISQYELPVVEGGSLRIALADSEKTVRLVRAHLEEDAGKSVHELGGDTAVAAGRGMSGIDLNRAGTPLLEIVSEPDMRSAAEAVAYARALHALVMWIGICDGNMQEGSFRCDANVSVRQPGAPLGTRCEIKNLNSFRFLERAIEYEAKRQIELIEDGGKVTQETRLFDAERGETRSMRSKEDAQDYRYFPDPDLLPLVIQDAEIERVRATLPELPEARCERFGRDFGLSAYDAGVLTSTRASADYFEALVASSAAEPKLCANWQTGELAGALNRDEKDFTQNPMTPEALGGLLRRIADGTLSGKLAKEVFDVLWRGEASSADEVIEKRGLKQISDTGAIEKLVDEVLAANAAQVADYLAGKEKAFNSLVGQVMKASRGKANPAQVNETLKRRLAR